MRKLLVVLSLLLLGAWSLPEAHVQANKTLVTVGEWCSGTIVSSNKIVTANHCLPDIRQDNSFKALEGQPYGMKFFVPVTVTRHITDTEGNEVGKVEYKAVVYKYDEKHDVAILANVSDIKFAEWVAVNTSPVQAGDKVYTIGNPHMWYNAVSTGTVAIPKLMLNFGGGDIPVILHDASSAPGSSGGGLFNDKGELIGITNWSVPDTPYKLASPVINYVRLNEK